MSLACAIGCAPRSRPAPTNPQQAWEADDGYFHVDFKFKLPTDGWSISQRAVTADTPTDLLWLTRDSADSDDVAAIVLGALGEKFDGTEEHCKKLGQLVAELLQGELTTSSLSDTCHAIVSEPDGSEARGVIMRGPRRDWIVVCQHRPGDDTVAEECESVRATWHWRPEPTDGARSAAQ